MPSSILDLFKLWLDSKNPVEPEDIAPAEELGPDLEDEENNEQEVAEPDMQTQIEQKKDILLEALRRRYDYSDLQDEFIEINSMKYHLRSLHSNLDGINNEEMEKLIADLGIETYKDLINHLESNESDKSLIEFKEWWNNEFPDMIRD